MLVHRDETESRVPVIGTRKIKRGLPVYKYNEANYEKSICRGKAGDVHKEAVTCTKYATAMMAESSTSDC